MPRSCISSYRHPKAKQTVSAGRQGHLLRYRRPQPQACALHARHARGHERLGGRARHPARRHAAKAAGEHRLLAGAGAEPHQPESLQAERHRQGAERHHHRSHAHRCRGSHGAGRYAHAGRARQAGSADRLRHPHRQHGGGAGRALQRRAGQPRRIAAAGRAGRHSKAASGCAPSRWTKITRPRWIPRSPTSSNARWKAKPTTSSPRAS